jgi:hypothetical protein
MTQGGGGGEEGGMGWRDEAVEALWRVGGEGEGEEVRARAAPGVSLH